MKTIVVEKSHLLPYSKFNGDHSYDDNHVLCWYFDGYWISSETCEEAKEIFERFKAFW